MSYREVNTDPESFYVDSFAKRQQFEIMQVLRASGGAVEYDRTAQHLGEPRARYKITLPAGCTHSGSDTGLTPQVVTLPDGRALCIYPRDDSVMVGWLSME